MPGDLLLSIKGTIGAVALVPDDAAVDGDSGFWTAGQSFMVLRPRKGGCSSIALFEYLSNNAVRETLRSLAGGAGIPTVSIKDLRQFKVPILTPVEEAEIEANFWDPPKSACARFEHVLRRLRKAGSPLGLTTNFMKLVRETSWHQTEPTYRLRSLVTGKTTPNLRRGAPWLRATAKNSKFQ